MPEDREAQRAQSDNNDDSDDTPQPKDIRSRIAAFESNSAPSKDIRKDVAKSSSQPIPPKQPLRSNAAASRIPVKNHEDPLASTSTPQTISISSPSALKTTSQPPPVNRSTRPTVQQDKPSVGNSNPAESRSPSIPPRPSLQADISSAVATPLPSLAAPDALNTSPTSVKSLGMHIPLAPSPGPSPTPSPALSPRDEKAQPAVPPPLPARLRSASSSSGAQAASSSRTASPAPAPPQRKTLIINHRRRGSDSESDEDVAPTPTVRTYESPPSRSPWESRLSSSPKLSQLVKPVLPPRKTPTHSPGMPNSASFGTFLQRPPQRKQSTSSLSSTSSGPSLPPRPPTGNAASSAQSPSLDILPPPIRSATLPPPSRNPLADRSRRGSGNSNTSTSRSPSTSVSIPVGTLQTGASLPQPGSFANGAAVNPLASEKPMLAPGTIAVPKRYIDLWDKLIKEFGATPGSAEDGRMEGAVIKEVWKQSKLSRQILGRIWNQCDTGRHGSLDRASFCKGMQAIDDELQRRRRDVSRA